MFLDALTLVSDAQAFGAAAVSTNSIDRTLTAPGSQDGTGEPVGFGITLDAGATVAAPIIEVISATDAALTTSIISHGSMTIPLATAVAGFQTYLGIPPGTQTQRYMGVRITTAGGTITATIWATPRSMFSIAPRSYPKGYTN